MGSDPVKIVPSGKGPQAASAETGAGNVGKKAKLDVGIALDGNTAAASITADPYGNTEYTYVWTASSVTNTVYSYGGPIATFDLAPGQYTITVTAFGNVGGKATAVHRYLTIE